MIRRPPRSTLFPYTNALPISSRPSPPRKRPPDSEGLVSSTGQCGFLRSGRRDSNPRPPPWQGGALPTEPRPRELQDRKSTRLNSSHSQISYAVFCLIKKNHQV